MPNEVVIEVTVTDPKLGSELMAIRGKVGAALKGLGGEIPIKFKVDDQSAVLRSMHNNMDMLSHDLVGLRQSSDANLRAMHNNFDMISHDLVVLRQIADKTGEDVDSAGTKMDRAARRAGAGWRWFGMNFWQMARTVVTAGGEIAAILVPAGLAAGVGAFVAYQGAVEMTGRHLQALFGTMEAQGTLFKKTTGDVLGLGHAFQTAQDAANPRIFQLYGAALELDRAHFMNLASMGLQVTDIIDRFSARVRLDMMSSQQQVGLLRAKAVPDLTSLAQVFGTLGHAVFMLAGKMPGVAEMILNLANTAAKAVNWFAQLPTPLVKTALGLEAAHRWGGLLSRNVFGPLIGQVGNFSDKIGMSSKVTNAFGKAAKFLGGSWGWVPIAAAVVGVILVNALENAKNKTDQFVDSTNRMLGASKNVNILNAIMAATPKVSERLASATQTLNFQLAHAHVAYGVLSNRIGDFSGATERAAGDVYHLSTQQKALNSETSNVLQGAAMLEKAYGVTFVGALVLADQANVKLKNSMQGNSEAARLNRLQIADLVAGYRAMQQPIGAIGSDMDALGIQSELQGTKVLQLNQAWDQYMQTLTNGTNDLAQFSDAVRNLKQDALGSANSFTGTMHSIGAAADKTKFSLQGMGKVSSQSWQQFDQIVGTSAPQLIDWLRIAGTEGVISQHDFTRAIRGTIAQLLPFAAHSKAATAELSALARQAGGPSTSDFKTLKDWVDKGHVSMADLRNIIDKTTVKMGDMGKVAENLGAVVQTNIIATMGKAKLTFFGVNGAVTVFTDALKKDGAQSMTTRNAYTELVNVLTKVIGNHHQAKNIADAYARSLGDTKTQTDKNTVATKAFNKQLDLIHSKDVTIKETGHGQFSIFGQGVGKGQLWHMARGGMVSGAGTGTSDSNITALSNGEFVVNANSAAKHKELLHNINAKGMASGGFVGPAGGLAETTGRFDKTFFKDFTDSMVRAIKHASMVIPGVPGGLGGSAGGSELHNLMIVAKYMMMAGASRAAAAGIAGTVAGESGGDPESVGSGGFGLIGWTGNTIGLPPGYTGPTGNFGFDMAVQLRGMLGYINANGGLGPLNASAASGGPLAAADLFSIAYERPRITFSDVRPEIVSQLFHMGFDRGGWLQPGYTLAYNGTGRPERVSPSGGGGVRVVFDVSGGDKDLKNWIKKIVRVEGGGDVQVAFGWND